jgi:phosphomannomutase
MAKGGKISPETEFKKGQSGNPNGRPKKLPEIDKLMAEVMGEEKDGITAAQAILNMLRGKAAKGDIKAAQLLLERAYGKSKQNIDITTQGEKVTVPTIIFTKDNKANEKNND